MKIVKAVKDFSLNGIIYSSGDEVQITNKDELIKLNEKGFIEPLSFKEIQNFGKEPKKIKKDEEE